MSSNLVRVEREEGIAILTLNRPEKKNALNGALLEALGQALDSVRDDMSIRAVLLGGAGGGFSSGIDHGLLMEVFQKSQEVPFRHLHADLQRSFDRIEQMERPVIAVTSRWCVGLALELALACDFRISTSDCVFGLPEVAFGIIPDVGGTTRLVRAVGPQRAREMILTGRLVTANKAERIGLVSQVAPTEAEAWQRARALAARIARFPAAGVGLAKVMVMRSADVDSASSLRLEGWIQSILLRQPDLGAAFPDALAFIKAEMESPDDG